MKHIFKAAPTVLLATSIALGLAACAKSEDKKVATQVAAKVGSAEISVHQINLVLNNANTNGATPEAVKGMSREVLEKLIDQQLAIAQAGEKKLDRTPEVVAQLEASKRDILARAYVQQLVSAVPKPTLDDEKKYYADHPQLFAERRVFKVQELIMPAQPGLVDQLGALSKAGKSVDDIVTWLKSKDIKYSGGIATRAAEQIPMDLLSRLQALKDGQSLVAQTPQAITLIHLAASKSEPLDETSALPRIEQYLSNQRANEAIASNMKALRQTTKIEYMGDFAKADATAAPGSTAAVSAPAGATAATAQDQSKATLEKGIAGLK